MTDDMVEFKAGKREAALLKAMNKSECTKVPWEQKDFVAFIIKLGINSGKFKGGGRRVLSVHIPQKYRKIWILNYDDLAKEVGAISTRLRKVEERLKEPMEMVDPILNPGHSREYSRDTCIYGALIKSIEACMD